MLRYAALTLASILFVFSLNFAQSQAPVQPSAESYSSTLWVTAKPGADRVRFASLGMIRGMRLEVLNPSGDRVFDSGSVEGSLLDWKLDDGSGHPLADGLYGFLVTVSDLGGRQLRRRGVLWVRAGTASFDNSQRPISSSPEENADSLTRLRQHDRI
jgi:hypothetical protein